MSSKIEAYFNNRTNEYKPLRDQEDGVVSMQGADINASDQGIIDFVNTRIRPQMKVAGKTELTDKLCKACKEPIEDYTQLKNSNFCLLHVYQGAVQKSLNNVTPAKITLDPGMLETLETPVQFTSPDDGGKITFGSEGEMYFNGILVTAKYVNIPLAIQNKDPYQFLVDRTDRTPTIEVIISTHVTKGDSILKGSCVGTMRGQVCQSLRLGVPCQSLIGETVSLPDSALPGIPGFGAPCIRNGNPEIRDICHECYAKARELGCVTTNPKANKKKKTVVVKQSSGSPRANTAPNNESRKTLARLTKERDDLMSINATLKSENQELKETVDSYGGVIDIDRKRIDRLQEKNESKDILIAKLRAEIVDLKSKLERK